MISEEEIPKTIISEKEQQPEEMHTQHIRLQLQQNTEPKTEETIATNKQTPRNNELQPHIESTKQEVIIEVFFSSIVTRKS